MRLRPKNWNEFQRYKGRNPPWVKLHKRLFDDFEFQSLPLASKALAPMLWLLASEDGHGWITCLFLLPKNHPFSMERLAAKVQEDKRAVSYALRLALSMLARRYGYAM